LIRKHQHAVLIFFQNFALNIADHRIAPLLFRCFRIAALQELFTQGALRLKQSKFNNANHLNPPFEPFLPPIGVYAKFILIAVQPDKSQSGGIGCMGRLDCGFMI
jgi:hypothetical protein